MWWGWIWQEKVGWKKVIVERTIGEASRRLHEIHPGLKNWRYALTAEGVPPNWVPRASGLTEEDRKR